VAGAERQGSRVGTAEERIADDLLPLVRPIDGLWEDPENRRLHGERSLQSQKDSLAFFGQEKPIVATVEGRVIAGNGVLRAAAALGWPDLAVVVWDGSDRQAREYGIADNRTGELSTFNEEALARQVGAIAAADPMLASGLGFNASERAAQDRLLQRLLQQDAMGGNEPLPASGSEREPQSSTAGTADALVLRRVDFADDDEHALWLRFLDWLTHEFPGASTVTTRLLGYIESLTDPRWNSLAAGALAGAPA
jgi:hypothetical protein